MPDGGVFPRTGRSRCGTRMTKETVHMHKKKFNVAVAGATGAVGNQMITCLEEADFPVKSIRLLASARSVGRKLRFRGDLV
ncbi:MAG TPA: hypothetical protein VFX82_08915, partial [Desulfobacterales bacterium]|nr:hypothetical protein [Desulfobacterales bacterium]